MTDNKILYNVTVKIAIQRSDEWLTWMTKVHIPEVMATKKFESFQINKIIEEDPQANTFAIQYTAPNMATFQAYQSEHAKALQEDHKKNFEGHYVAFRTLMEIIDPR